MENPNDEEIDNIRGATYRLEDVSFYTVAYAAGEELQFRRYEHVRYQNGELRMNDVPVANMNLRIASNHLILRNLD